MELSEILDEDVFNKFEELKVTAQLLDYEINVNEGDYSFSKVDSYIYILFAVGVARIMTIVAAGYNSNDRINERVIDNDIEDQLELFEDLLGLLE